MRTDEPSRNLMSATDKANEIVLGVIEAIQSTEIPDNLNPVYNELANRTLAQVLDEDAHEVLCCMVARLMLLVSRQNYSVATYSPN